MSNTVIRVEDLSKLYRLGEVGTGTLSHDLNRWWARVRGKEDPFAIVGETNDRTARGSSDYVWALKDINFEVKQGEVLGIIGRNGAGKSTLLKILSKVTQPSRGSIKIKGRIASLLEVGTGFHPELTGRENIFLNGAILGMTKAEIRSKLDAIIDFAGVERYIDTPVKRYSSGMYVRLAFAVSAFLEPEILIVDEVLAVGDAEFQKKCLGRMKDVSVNDGRTVLFVSHNLAAIQKLCTSAALFNNGTIVKRGNVDVVLNSYLDFYNVVDGSVTRTFGTNDASKKVFIRRASLLDSRFEIINTIKNNNKTFLEIEVDVLKEGIGYNIGFELWSMQHDCILSSCFFDTQVDEINRYTWKVGSYKLQIELPVQILKEGNYYLTVSSAIPSVQVLDIFPVDLRFKVNDVCSPIYKTGEGRNGAIVPILEWKSS